MLVMCVALRILQKDDEEKKSRKKKEQLIEDGALPPAPCPMLPQPPAASREAMPTFMAALEKETGWNVEKETLPFGAGWREEVMCKVSIRLR